MSDLKQTLEQKKQAIYRALETDENVWARIIPRSRETDFKTGVEARTADPLWALARQWQTGEFLGEDAGTPVDVSFDCARISTPRIYLGENTSAVAKSDNWSNSNESVAQGDPPLLEKVVEYQPPAWDLFDRVRVGQAFERELENFFVAEKKQGFADFLKALWSKNSILFSIQDLENTLDQASHEYAIFIDQTVTDGLKLNSRSLSNPDVNVISNMQLNSIKLETLKLFPHLTRPHSSVNEHASWQSNELSHKFRLTSSARTSREPKLILHADDYRSGKLDWYSFAAENDRVKLDNVSSDDIAFNSTPNRIAISGLSPRWWAFEDEAIDLNLVDVTQQDLIKILLLEFILIYGDDWFIAPLTFPLGNIAGIKSMVVKDVFGLEVKVGSVNTRVHENQEPFELFTLSDRSRPNTSCFASISDADDITSLLYIPPVAHEKISSEALEDVIFMKDENANLSWAIEHTVSNAIGEPIRTSEWHLELLELAKQQEKENLEKLLRYIDSAMQGLSISGGEQKVALLKQLALQRYYQLGLKLSDKDGSQSLPQYQLVDVPPLNWHPLKPKRSQARGDLYLRAKFLNPVENLINNSHMLDDGFLREVEKRLQLADQNLNWVKDTRYLAPLSVSSELLGFHNDSALVVLHEEALPPIGLRVRVTKQKCRWTDGSTHIWTGREVVAGRGEIESGLRFDSILQPD